MTTQERHTPTELNMAQQFGKAMAKVAHSDSESEKVAATFSFKVVKFKKHNDRRGLRFSDGSKLFFGDEGKLVYEETKAQVQP